METIEYHLKSDPTKHVRVPTDYASKAESVVKLAMESPASLPKSTSEHPYLRNPGILMGSLRLASTIPGSPQSLKLQDEVYLRVCLYGNEQKLRGPERKEALELDRTLVSMVQDL